MILSLHIIIYISDNNRDNTGGNDAAWVFQMFSHQLDMGAFTQIGAASGNINTENSLSVSRCGFPISE